MHVVMTRIKLKPGVYKRCAELFQKTNPGLVSGEPDWLGARMIFDHETDIVTVLATWRDTDSYKRLNASSEFQQIMREFSEFFASPPEISMNQVLVDMKL
jgi:quinol monooxygenase YgiN